MKKAVIYARYSSHKQREESIERQGLLGFDDAEIELSSIFDSRPGHQKEKHPSKMGVFLF